MMSVLCKFEKVDDDNIRTLAFHDCFVVSLKKNDYSGASKFVFIDRNAKFPKIVIQRNVQFDDTSAIILPSIDSLTVEMAEELLGIKGHTIYVSHLPLVKNDSHGSLNIVQVFNK